MRVVNKKLLETFFLVFISLLYLGLTLYNLPYPGLRDDEAQEAFVAYKILHEKLPINQYLMYSPYYGTIQIYAILPFFAFLDMNVYTLRIAMVFYAFLTLIILYYLIKEILGKTQAIISILILATLPTFIFYTRIGVLTNSFILVPLFGSLLFFTKGIKKNNFIYFCLSSFLFGLGFSTKITFWWLVLPCIIYMIVFRKLIRLDIMKILICCIFFCLGAIPIIIYNVISNFGTLRYIISNVNTSHYSFLHNIAVRFIHFMHLLNGNLDYLPLGTHYFNQLLPVLFILSIVVLAAFEIINKKKSIIALIIITFIIILIESTFSFSVNGIIVSVNYITWHIYLLLPFGIAIIAHLLSLSLKVKKLGKLLLVLSVSIIIFSNLSITLKYHRIIKQTGGTEYMSSKMYELADYLKTKGINSLLYFDTHFRHNLLFLSDGAIDGENICDFMNANCGNEVIHKLQEGILNKHTYYIISNPKWILLPWIYQVLKDYLTETNQTLTYTKIFYDSREEPLYYILALTNQSDNFEQELIFPGKELNLISFMRAYPCRNCNITFNLSSKRDENALEVKYFIPTPPNKAYLFLHKVIERIFGFDRDSGFVWFYRDYYFLNFSNYSAINLYIKSDNQTSGLEFQIKEHDGDAWYYFDNHSLANTNWTLIHMPFTNFKSPLWASHGDRKKTFDNVVLIGMTLTSFDKAVNKTVYFKTFGDQIFYLD